MRKSFQFTEDQIKYMIENHNKQSQKDIALAIGVIWHNVQSYFKRNNLKASKKQINEFIKQNSKASSKPKLVHPFYLSNWHPITGFIAHG